MKTIKLSILAVAAFATAACTADEPVNVQEGGEITIYAGVVNGGTKVNFTDNDAEKTVYVNWNEKDEAFTAFIGGTSSEFAQTGAPDETGRAYFSGTIPQGTSASSTFYAVYPESASLDQTAVAINLNSQDGRERDEKNTYMYASSTLGAVENEGLAFKHLGSVIKLNLGFADASDVAVTEGTVKNVVVSASDCISSATVDLTKESPKVTAVEKGSISLSGEFTMEGGKAVVYVHVLPAVFADLAVSAVIGDKTYSAVIGGRTDGKAMEAGRQYSVSATCREYVQSDWYVTVDGSASGASWDEPTDLTTALAGAADGATIHVAAGTYYPTANLPYTTLPEGDAAKGFLIDNNITLIGGYPANPSEGAVADASANATILSGKNASYHVLIVAAPKEEGKKVVVEGITVTEGAKGVSSNSIKINNLSVLGNYAAGIAVFGTMLDLNNVTISGNTGENAAGMYVVKSGINMVDCVMNENAASGNCASIWLTDGTDLVLNGCKLYDNYAKGLASGIYFYNNGDSSTLEVINSVIYNNETSGRGGALYARNNISTDLVVNCVNTTFADNISGSWGGAINQYGAATKKTYVNLISCTVTGNESTNASYPGAVTCETAGTTLNTYNTIIAGNTVKDKTGYNDVNTKSGISATISHKSSFVGSQYYNASGAAADVSPVFDVDTMLGAFDATVGVCKLVGTAETNPAIGNGMTTAELSALASGSITAAVLTADQTGAERTGRVVGACVL